MTELFNNGFEEGNFSAWTGTSGSPTIVGSPVHHGSYAAQMDANNEYCYKNYTKQAVYVRLYVRFSALPGNAKANQFLWLRSNADGVDLLKVEIYNSGGTIRFRVIWRNISGSNVTVTTDVAPVVDAWYCIEARWAASMPSGTTILWIDGVAKASTNNVSDGFNSDQIRVGTVVLTSGYTCTNTVDCVVVADVYVGPEAAGQLYEVFVDAVAQSLSTPAYETAYNIAKDASVNSQGLAVSEATFNLLPDAVVQALASVVVEIVTGVIEVFKDAIVTVQSGLAFESAFSIFGEAFVNALADKSFEFGVPVEAAVKALADNALELTFSIPVEAVAKAVCDPMVESVFALAPEAAVRVIAEAIVVKEGEVKVTKLFLVFGDLAIQIQGS